MWACGHFIKSLHKIITNGQSMTDLTQDGTRLWWEIYN